MKENIKSCALLDVVRGIQRLPVNSPHKEPVTRKMFAFDDVIMRIDDFYNYTTLSIPARGHRKHQILIMQTMGGSRPALRNQSRKAKTFYVDETTINIHCIPRLWGHYHDQLKSYAAWWCLVYSVAFPAQKVLKYGMMQTPNLSYSYVLQTHKQAHHDDVIKWKHFPRDWPFVRGIHWWIPLTKASDVELGCFLWSGPEQTVE